MTNCNSVETPVFTTRLYADKDREPFDEPWDYASIVGMLMLLANSTRPDKVYASLMRSFCHAPRRGIHAAPVKRILRYLKRS